MTQATIERLLKELSEILSEKHGAKVTITATPAAAAEGGAT